MELAIFDALPLALLIIAAPIYSVMSFRNVKKRLADDADHAREASYVGTIWVEWAFLGLVLAIWLAEGRELVAIGLGVSPTPGFIVTTGLVIVALGVMVHQVFTARRDAEYRAKVRATMKDLILYVPHTRSELRMFFFVSATAGVCEEIVYRGYLMAVLGVVGGPVAAVIGSTVIFMLGHAYQPATILRVGAVGLVTALLYLLSGSVIPVIVLHIAVDVSSGLTTFFMVNDGSSDGSATVQPAA